VTHVVLSHGRVLKRGSSSLAHCGVGMGHGCSCLSAIVATDSSHSEEWRRALGGAASAHATLPAGHHVRERHPQLDAPHTRIAENSGGGKRRAQSMPGHRLKMHGTAV